MSHPKSVHRFTSRHVYYILTKQLFCGLIPIHNVHLPGLALTVGGMNIFMCHCINSETTPGNENTLNFDMLKQFSNLVSIFRRQ